MRYLTKIRVSVEYSCSNTQHGSMEFKQVQQKIAKKMRSLSVRKHTTQARKEKARRALGANQSGWLMIF